MIRRSEGGTELIGRIEAGIREATASLRQKGTKYFLDNGLSILRSKTFRAWFPLQKGMAIWMGETKLRHRPRPLISPAQLRDLEGMLEPGDLLLERRNWNLSNVGLPGFWPHVALYVGSPDRMKSYFEDTGLAESLRRDHPSSWRRYHGAHDDGDPKSVIEALAPGVVFNSFPKSAGADYVGVLRPDLPRREKSEAISRAFGYLGRPYDFDFDFLTDTALVCSELVWKCYQPGAGFRGIPFEPGMVAGRTVLPPNDMVAQFDRWRERGESPLRFVAFLDGVERKRCAVERGEKEFRASHRRPKWDLAQR